LLATAEQAFASHHVKEAAHRIRNLTFNLSEIEAMNAFAKIKSSEFTINNPLNYRDKPEIEWMHKLGTRAHLNYLHDRKLFDVNGPEWAQATVNGEVVYAHEYEGCVFTVSLKAAKGKLTLSHNADGSLDRHLADHPGEDTVYAITSSNNGLESTQTFTVAQAGLGSIPIICLALVMTVSLANAMVAAEAALAAEAAVAAICGVEVTVFPIVGIVLAVLAFIGIWLAYILGREIMLNLTYENRSTKSIILFDHWVYNIGDSTLIPTELKPLHTVGPFEFYDDVKVLIDNYSKYKGIGVSMRFKKPGDKYLTICIRQDIYSRVARGNRTPTPSENRT
jgi:hypothetical protein